MLSSAHYTNVADLASAQFEALVSAPVYAGAGEGFEESQAFVDADETQRRIARHRDRTGTPHAAYEAYVTACVDALGLDNISGAEIVAVHKRVLHSGVRNQLPPPAQLASLLGCLCIDQDVRDTAGLPLRFNSLYRSPAYNKAIGGARQSRHLRGDARDRVLVGGSIAQLAQIDENTTAVRSLESHQAAAIRRVLSDYSLVETNHRLFVQLHGGGMGVHVDGGIGTYRTFVHRDNRGYAARWS